MTDVVIPVFSTSILQYQCTLECAVAMSYRYQLSCISDYLTNYLYFVCKERHMDAVSYY
jgi:hypothetical protein